MPTWLIVTLCALSVHILAGLACYPFKRDKHRDRMTRLDKFLELFVLYPGLGLLIPLGMYLDWRKKRKRGY